MKKKTWSTIASIFITIIVVTVICIYAAVVLSASMNIGLKILIELTLLFLIGISLYVLIDRIKEIRSGKYDDISKYWLCLWS